MSKHCWLCNSKLNSVINITNSSAMANSKVIQYSLTVVKRIFYSENYSFNPDPKDDYIYMYIYITIKLYHL